MPRFPRLVVPGLPHHVTQRGVRRQNTFFGDSDYRRYLDIAVELADDWAVEFWAYCLMPNHMHAIVVPGASDSLSKYFAILHRRYARRTNLHYEWTGHLWQKRFFSVVVDEPHCVAALRYVENNPVRAGLCTETLEWSWSSARANLGLATDPLIDRARTRGLIPDWSAFTAEEDDPPAIERIREWTGTGRPGGDERFLLLVEGRTGRRVRKKSPGRKGKRGTGHLIRK